MPRAKLNKAARAAAIRAALDVLASFGITPDEPRKGLMPDEIRTGEFTLMTSAGPYTGEIYARASGVTVHCRFNARQDRFGDVMGRPIYKDNDYSGPDIGDALAVVATFKARLHRYGARSLTDAEAAAREAERVARAVAWHKDMIAAGLIAA